MMKTSTWILLAGAGIGVYMWSRRKAETAGSVAPAPGIVGGGGFATISAARTRAALSLKPYYVYNKQCFSTATGQEAAMVKCQALDLE